MSIKRPKDLAASIRQRLANKAKEQKEDFGVVLTRYGLERFLYRLSLSPYSDQFVLKGAMLFQQWSGQTHRPTRDLDFLGYGEPAPERYCEIVSDICTQEAEADGLKFLPQTIHAETMKEGEDYQGIRIKLDALLSSARIPILIDVGFGDAVTPGLDEITYPTMLELPAPHLKAYPRETVIAEKFQAMVSLGIANSRMKDFYDLWTLSQEFDFAGASLSNAINATFKRRSTALPRKLPLALTEEFTLDAQKLNQWKAFLRKSKLVAGGKSLPEIATDLERFLIPPTQALVTNEAFHQMWSAGETWQDK